MRTKKLISTLQTLGLNPKFVPASEPSLEDDMIEVTENCHISIDQYGGACAVKEENGIFTFYRTTNKFELIVEDVKKILAI